MDDAHNVRNEPRMDEALGAMRRGIEEAARWYKLKGLKMTIWDGQQIRKVDPDEVLRANAQQRDDEDAPLRRAG